MAGSYTKRVDKRKFDELRPIKAEVGIIPNADGSAMFAFGKTVAIAAVYGPKPLHPAHMQDPEKGTARDRKGARRPGAPGGGRAQPGA